MRASEYTQELLARWREEIPGLRAALPTVKGNGRGALLSKLYVRLRALGGIPAGESLQQFRSRYYSDRKEAKLARYREELPRLREELAKETDERERYCLRSRITGDDLCIIDECVGKYRISESGQEVLFEILERINSGRCRSRIWLLGNFYTGSIEAIFADPEPVRRRLQENFCCACITAQGEIKTIQGYGGKR